MHSAYRLLKIFIVVAALIPVPHDAGAQDSAFVRGTVLTADGKPVDGANVFLLETLDGVVTGADGRFSIKSTEALPTVVARRVGFVPQTIKITVDQKGPIVIRLERSAPVLTPITVMAGRYTANEERTATLTPLEVVTTPGTAADVNRALQTLPGIQQVDEGTGLFVRGGDYTETKVFLNEAAMLNPLDVVSPSGTFMGTVDPFLLDGIVFSSGGFGARFGNALSGAVDLHTQAMPLHRTLSASAGLAGISMSVAEPVSHRFGLRGATNLFDLRPLISVNGSSTKYDPAPRGHDLSVSAYASLLKAGELSLFAIDKTQQLGVGVDDPSYSGTYDLSTGSRLAVATWRADFGNVVPAVTASVGTVDKDEQFGAFLVRTRFKQQQVFGQWAWTQSPTLTVRAGAELEHLRAAFDGSVPNTALDVAPGSRIRKLGSDAAATRTGLFMESDNRIGLRLRLVAGARADHSDLTDETTFDPRVSAAFRTIGSATLTAAWGIYHETPDPLLFDPVIGDTTLKAMRAAHYILGMQAGDNERMLRVELYDKLYENLSRQTRDYGVASHGNGYARGADIFLKGTAPFALRTRLTYSYVHSRRTDSDTGLLADAPFDVPHTMTFIVQRTIANWEAGAAYRYSTGRPFSPVVRATYNAVEERWIPSYGSPYSERLPNLVRADVSLSNIRQITPDWRIVLYASVNNVLGRHNIYSYTYTADFTERKPVPSLFDRSLYVGATLLH